MCRRPVRRMSNKRCNSKWGYFSRTGNIMNEIMNPWKNSSNNWWNFVRNSDTLSTISLQYFWIPMLVFSSESSDLKSHSWKKTQFFLKALPSVSLDCLVESATFSSIAARHKVISANITLVSAMLLFSIIPFIIQSIWTH